MIGKALGHWPPNREVFWITSNTYHYQAKNDQIEGIRISWKGNPFDLHKISYYNYPHK